MNIVINDNKVLLDILNELTIETFITGSKLYGTSDEHSDTDYLHIIATPNNLLDSLAWYDDQFIFKIDGDDHIFTTIHGFYRNLIRGESTMNYEIATSKQFEESSLCSLSIFSDFLKTKQVARSFIGRARSDLKVATRVISTGKDPRAKKKLGHVVRGICRAREILFNDDSNFHETEIYKEIQTNEFNSYLIPILKSNINDLKEQLTNSTLPNYLDPVIGVRLSDKIAECINYHHPEDVVVPDFVVELIYENLNNCIQHN